MPDAAVAVVIRDSTLREGMDTPGVSFSLAQRLKIARALDEAGVPEIEVVAPSRVSADLACVRAIRDAGLGLHTTGLIYCTSPRVREEIAESAQCLHRFDVLMPVSKRRKPFAARDKLSLLLDVLAIGRVAAGDRDLEVGVGFPHATQSDEALLLGLAAQAAEQGASRVTVYDTNGSAEPFAVRSLVRRVRRACGVPVFFHAHNDLGLATANALAAVSGGAAGLDVTVNGLGDRAGNASLEQVVLGLHLRQIDSGVALASLPALSALVASESGVPVANLAPVVGDFVARHVSPSHLSSPDLFEAYDPALLGIVRTIDAAPPAV